MDSNLMSCQTCGHSINNISLPCPYCGALMSTKEPQPQTEEAQAVDSLQVSQAPPPLPQEKSPPADAAAPEADEAPPAALEPDDVDLPREPADSPAVAEASETATQADTVTDGDAAPVEDAVESMSSPPDGEPKLEIKAETEAPSSDLTDDFEDQTQLPVEPKVLELAGDEPGESETLGENIAELLESEASRQVSAPQSIPETPPLVLETPAPPVKSVDAAKSSPAEAVPPETAEEITIDGEAGSLAESLGDTIVLEAVDEVLPPAGELPDEIEKTVILETPAEAEGPKITKIGQAMAVAAGRQAATLAEDRQDVKPQTEATKAGSLKKEKTALAKAHAQKQQKLMLAKAAALKRKKAAQAKALALKKQQTAQVAIESANHGQTAAAGRSQNHQDLAANNKMQSLLEKYKDQAIGINYDNSADIREARLVEANGEFFSVYVKDKKLHYSYPLKTILTVIEGEDGVNTGDSKQPVKFNAVIKVYPLVLF